MPEVVAEVPVHQIHRQETEKISNIKLMFKFFKPLHSLFIIMDHLKFNNTQKLIDMYTLNLEATEENLYDDLEDSSGNKGKRPDTKGHFEEDNRLQCSATT